MKASLRIDGNLLRVSVRVLLIAGMALAPAGAAPIPKLFNTGVNDAGELVAGGSIDPHYTLIQSADPLYPGPACLLVAEAWPVAPAGPWMASGPLSKWIAPRPEQRTGNDPGEYTYRTTFDLTGYDSTKAHIAGKWSVDNGGVDIMLNSVSLGIINGAGFGSWSEFTIESGFVDGINTLDFVVSNAGDAVNPTALRVEMVGTVEVAGELPRIITQPLGATLLAGDNYTLSVVADGTPPLTYEWFLDDQRINGATEPTLAFAPAAAASSGMYHVVVKNDLGERPSDKVQITVLEPIPGLYPTGLSEQSVLLDDYAVDPHYKLLVNPDSGSQDAYVEDSSLFPIVAGPWLANSDTSKWIGPLGETSGAAGGDYTYRLTIDLTGFDPTTAFISAQWSSDNAATLILNDAPTGISFDGNFAAFSPVFTVSSGFLSAVNTLDFKVNNAGAGYTGLRVDFLRGGAKRAANPMDKPRVVADPQDALAFSGETVTFRVVVDGKQPFTYKWFFNGSEIPGSNNNILDLTGLSANNSGDYHVTINNSAGSASSKTAHLTVLDRVPGLFSTGVDPGGQALADGEVDPHYQITQNPDGATPDAIVEDSTVFPIVSGPWLANTDGSKWIGPRLNTTEAAAGDFNYRTSFDLTGFDPATAVLAGRWSTDNLGLDILLNGVSQGIQNGAQFGGYTDFTFRSGFIAGLNTIDFRLNNASAGYTGLRVDGLRAGANRGTPQQRPSLAIRRDADRLLLSWPAASTGFQLYQTGSLGGATWLIVPDAVVLLGDTSTVSLPIAGSARFFRLQKP